MSREVVRQPVTVADRTRRRLEERLELRFPRAAGLWARVLWRFFLRLPPRSRVRLAFGRHFAQRTFEALNRRDLESVFSLYHPDGESIFDQRMIALGFEPVTRGREARVEAQRQWMAEWGEIRIDPEEVIDLGDGRFLLSGRSGGRMTHEQIFLDRAEALEAAGLGE